MTMLKQLCLAAMTIAATAIASAAADDARIPSAEVLRADVIARGGAQPDEFGVTARGGGIRGSTCYGGDLLTAVRIETLPSAGSTIVDEAMVCPGLGVYWIRRHNSAAMGAMTIFGWAGPYPMHELAGKYGLAQRIRTEVDARSGDFLPTGTNDPDAGPNGELPPSLDDGGVLVALRVPPRNSADMFTETATIDPVGGLYWARRTGGFAGVDTWIGPFSVPVLQDLAPTATRPERIRKRKRGRRMNLTIRREMTGDADARVRRRDYSPADILLGDGIEVLRILRADRHRIRVRIRVARGAHRGERGVRVKTAYTDDLLTVR
jgi:hypothetical protein